MGKRRVAWAVAVGIASLGALAPPADATRASETTGSFRALTYNVAGLPEQLSGSEPATNSPLISPRLNAYDVVLLQENWADPLAQQRKKGLVPETVPRLGYHDLVVRRATHPYRSTPARSVPRPALSRVPTGPALTADGLNQLSRFMFWDLERVMWKQCHGELSVTVAEEVLKQSGLSDAFAEAGAEAVTTTVDGGATDCAAQKGFTVSTLQLARGVTVDLYNLHAEAGNGDADQAASKAGFAQLSKYIRKHSKGRAIVFGGDTNLHSARPDRAWEAATWRAFLDATGLEDVCEVVECGADTGRIDKFAFRSARKLTLTPVSYGFETARFTRSDGEPLSDHDPLAVTFRWVRPATP